MLKNEIQKNAEIKEKLNISTKNKILVVTHSFVMKGLTQYRNPTNLEIIT